MTRSTRVALKIYGAGARGKALKEKLPFAQIEGSVVVLRSALDEEKPLNDHLVWIWGLVMHERRVLKSVVEEGGSLVVECRVPKGELKILPNGAEFLHLIGAELILNQK